MTTMDTEPDVHSAIRDVRAALDRLDQLGGPDQIADHLLRAGIVGEPGCPFSCAIAEYLVRAVPAVCSAAVSVTDGVMFGLRGRRGTWTAQDLPDHVCAFIACFDTGAYPALIYRPEPLLTT